MIDRVGFGTKKYPSNLTSLGLKAFLQRIGVTAKQIKEWRENFGCKVREVWERGAVLREDTSFSLEFEFQGDGTTMREEEELGGPPWLPLIFLLPGVALDRVLTG